jgi:hypothetical protein
MPKLKPIVVENIDEAKQTISRLFQIMSDCIQNDLKITVINDVYYLDNEKVSPTKVKSIIRSTISSFEPQFSKLLDLYSAIDNLKIVSDFPALQQKVADDLETAFGKFRTIFELVDNQTEDELDNDKQEREEKKRLKEEEAAEKKRLKEEQAAERKRVKEESHKRKNDIEQYKKDLKQSLYDLDWPYRWRTNWNGQKFVYALADEYVIKMLDNNNLEEFCNSIQANVELYKIVYEVYKNYITAMNTNPPLQFQDFMSDVFDNFIINPKFRIVEEPQIFTTKPETWTFSRIDLTGLEAGPTPTWDVFFTQFDSVSAEIFKAWIWSIYEEKHVGRQALWVQGEGLNMKSIVTSVLSEWLPNGATSFSSDGLKGDFGMQPLINKRLLYCPDNRNQRLLSTEKMHQITGGDIVSVGLKFLANVQYKFKARVLIFANYSPEINTTFANERSRLIYLSMNRVDLPYIDDLETKMKNEKSSFLFACKKMYEKYCKNHYTIDVPAELLDRQMLKACSEEDALDHEWIDKNISKQENGHIISSDFYTRFITEQQTKNGFRFSNAKRYLISKYPDIETRKVKGINVLVGICWTSNKVN